MLFTVHKPATKCLLWIRMETKLPTSSREIIVCTKSISSIDKISKYNCLPISVKFDYKIVSNSCLSSAGWTNE